jgi:hypothetical protein
VQKSCKHHCCRLFESDAVHHSVQSFCRDRRVSQKGPIRRPFSTLAGLYRRSILGVFPTFRRKSLEAHFGANTIVLSQVRTIIVVASLCSDRTTSRSLCLARSAPPREDTPLGRCLSPLLVQQRHRLCGGAPRYMKRVSVGQFLGQHHQLSALLASLGRKSIRAPARTSAANASGGAGDPSNRPLTHKAPLTAHMSLIIYLRL